MKRIFILLFTITSIVGYAQTNSSFIEVTVADTVVLKAIQIKYLITGSANNSIDYGDYKNMENKYASQTDMTKIEKTLDAKKYTYSHYKGPNKYQINNTAENDIYYAYKKKDGLLVELNSIQELEELYHLFKDESGIKGQINEVIFENESKYNEQLLTKIYAKAQQEASLIAILTGSKLGKVISVSEESSDNYYSLNDFYSQLFTLGKLFDDGWLNKELTSVYSRRFTFKFETH